MAKTAAKARVKGTYGTMYFAKDVAKTARFFQETLGLKLAFASPEWTVFDVGGQSLCLHPDGAKSQPKNGTLILHVNGLRALVAELKAKGAKASEVREVHPGAWSADLTDPDGNVYSLYEGPASF